MNVVGFVNPLLDRRRRSAAIEALWETLGRRPVVTSDATELPRSGAGTIVVAIGGDGTVNRLLGALSARGIPMGVLPCGRANDFARALGIPLDLRRAAALLREPCLVDVDLAAVNGRPFATCGGFGLVASVSARANAWRRDRAPFRGLGRRLGPFTYPLATAVEILRGWEPVRVKIDGGGEPNPLAALVVSKQPRFGGSFRASPLASKTDGALHLCLIASPPTRRRMLWISLEILRGQGGRCPEVLNARGEKLTILAERDVRFYADGEPLAAGRSFRIEIRRGALPVVVPASYAGEEPSDAA